MIKRFGPAGAQQEEYKEKYSIDAGKIDYTEDVLVMYSFGVECEKLKAHEQYFPDHWKGLKLNALIKKLLSENLFLKPEIQHKAELFRAKYFTERMIGVHVRYTDNMSCPHKAISLENYSYAVERLIERDPSALIFLATDNEDVLKSYRSKYKNVIAIDKQYPPITNQMHGSKYCFDREQNGIEALIDLYLLAHCDYLVFSNKSSFGRIAGFISSAAWRNIYDVENSASIEKLKTAPSVT